LVTVILYIQLSLRYLAYPHIISLCSTVIDLQWNSSVELACLLTVMAKNIIMVFVKLLWRWMYWWWYWWWYYWMAN